MIIPDYIIELQNKTKKIIETIENISKLKNHSDQELEDKKKNSLLFKKKKFNKKKFNKKKFFKKTKSSPSLAKKD